MDEKNAELFPIFSTLGRFWEANYFFWMMLENYHNPSPFKYNFNAFIQALSSITQILDNEKQRYPEFKKWYSKKRAELKSNTLISSFILIRNRSVHRSTLKAKSIFTAGIFYNREPKLVIRKDMDSRFYTINLVKDFHSTFFLPDSENDTFPDEFSLLEGEELGIKREWIFEEIGPEEICEYCQSALLTMKQLVIEVHSFFDFSCHPEIVIPELDKYRIILESDIQNYEKFKGRCPY
jgi:hypothetical protein